jgi:hypothetical protein
MNRFIKSFKLFESVDLSKRLEDMEGDSEYIAMLLAELEDDNKYLVSCEPSFSDNHDENRIYISIKPRFKNYIILDDLDLDSRIEQILAVLPDYSLHGIEISHSVVRTKEVANIHRSLRSEESIFLKSISDYNVSDIIKKSIKDGYLMEYFSIFEPGMNSWENEMVLRLSNDEKSNLDSLKTYHFVSDIQFDDFEIDIDVKDLNSEVRLPINSIVVHLKLK